jgi:hypothetical protein
MPGDGAASGPPEGNLILWRVLTPPGPQHTIFGSRGGRFLFGAYQLPVHEAPNALLNSALRESRSFSHHLVACADGCFRLPGQLTPKMKVDKERRRGAVVPHKVAHQNRNYVVVDYYIFNHYSSVSHSNQNQID